MPESDMFHDAPHYFAFKRMCAAAILEKKARFETMHAAAKNKERITLLAGLHKTQQP